MESVSKQPVPGHSINHHNCAMAQFLGVALKVRVFPRQSLIAVPLCLSRHDRGSFQEQR